MLRNEKVGALPKHDKTKYQTSPGTTFLTCFPFFSSFASWPGPQRLLYNSLTQRPQSLRPRHFQSRQLAPQLHPHPVPHLHRRQAIQPVPAQRPGRLHGLAQPQCLDELPIDGINGDGQQDGRINFGLDEHVEGLHVFCAVGVVAGAGSGGGESGRSSEGGETRVA